MITKISHIEFCVANLVQATFFYEKIFELNRLSSSASIAPSGIFRNFLFQNDIKLVLSTSLDHNNSIAKHIAKHSEGVKDIAFIVSDTEEVFERAIKNNAKIIDAPSSRMVQGNKITIAKISGVGTIEHTLVSGISATNLVPELLGFTQQIYSRSSTGLFKSFDHVAMCVSKKSLARWIDWYANIFDLVESHEENVDTGESGMNSKVLESRNGSVKLVFTEPMEQYEKSQIQEFIDHNNGPGVQHLAFKTEDIVSAVNRLNNLGLEFLQAPKNYYENLLTNTDLQREIIAFQVNNILVDKDSHGYLFQAFTRPVQTRPPFFLELIQRQGSKGFGHNNIKSLFKMKEMEQANYDSL